MIVASLEFSQQCKDATGKANRMLSFINRNFLKNKNIMLPFYTSLVKPHLEYAVQVWSQFTMLKDNAKLEAVQRRTMKIIMSTCNKLHELGETDSTKSFHLRNDGCKVKKIFERFKIFKRFTNTDTRFSQLVTNHVLEVAV